MDAVAHAAQLIQALALSLNLGSVPVLPAPAQQWQQAGFMIEKRTAAFVLVCKSDRPGCRPGVALVSDRLPKSDSALECIARHELAHIELGHVHGARSVAEQRAHHEEVRSLLRARYGTEEVTCPKE